MSCRVEHGHLHRPNQLDRLSLRLGDTDTRLNTGFVSTALRSAEADNLEDAGEAAFGVELGADRRLRLNAGYTGTFARNWSNHSAQASLTIQF